MSATLSLIPKPSGKLYFAGLDQSHKFEVRVTDPVETLSMYINLYIYYGSEAPIIRSFPAVNNTTYYSVEFDLNEIFAGIWKDMVIRNENDSKHFDFPGDPDYPLVDKSWSLLLTGYFDFSYSYSNLVTGEMTDDGYISNKGNADYKFKILNGGVSRIMQAWLYSEGKDITDYLTENKKFLTWMPSSLQIHPRQPVRLYYYNPDLVPVKVITNIYYADGTSVKKEIGNYNKGMLLQVLAGISELRLANFDITKVIVKYELWLQNSDGTHITEKKTFITDRTFYERNDIFIYRNSLGVHEVFWSHGDRLEKLNVEKTQTIRPLLKPSSQRGSVISSRGIFYYSYEANTGYFSKADRAWVNEFLTCGEAFLPSGYVLHPVLIEKGEFSLAEDRNDLFSADYVFRVAHNETFYSGEPPVTSPFGDFNDDFNHDFFIS